MSASALKRAPSGRPSVAGDGIALRRIESICDPGSFRPLRTAVISNRSRRSQPGDGILAGSVLTGGRSAFVYAQDPSFLGGSLGAAHAETIVRVLEMARQSGLPAIGLIHSGGARMDEGSAALEGYGRIFTEHVRSSGWIPQISVIYGTSAGGGCYSPALNDLVIMCREANMFLTGPKVVEEVLAEKVDKQHLGGPEVHSRNGVAPLIAEDEADAARLVRSVLAYLPPNSDEESPRSEVVCSPEADPGSIVPASQRHVYDVSAVAEAIVDQGSLLELGPNWARNLLTGLARLGGRPVGVVANQPRYRAGVLDSAASEKGVWFIDLCNSFGLPLIVLEDTPGFMPGSSEESRGVIRHGASLVRAFAGATVPRLTVVLRKGFGGAFITMNSRALGADMVLAWPSAEIGIMAATQAVGIQHGRELAAADDPEELRTRLSTAYAAEHTTAEVAAANGVVDEVIDPADTRDRLLGALEALGSRRRAR
jgi:acetyl-CoA carboxylase carboxyltransferase component